MNYDRGVEEALNELIRDAEAKFEAEEERHQNAIKQIERDVGSRRSTLNAYLAKYGRNREHADAGTNAELIAALRGVTYREMLRRWASAHDGLLAMKDLINAVTSAGYFKKRAAAHKSLYSTVAQAVTVGEFRKEAPGLYRYERFRDPRAGEPDVPPDGGGRPSSAPLISPAKEAHPAPHSVA